MRPIRFLRLTLLGLAFLLGAAAASPQSTTAPAVGTKIAVVNILQAISSTAEGKQGAAELEAQFLPRQQELESLNKQLSDLQQRLNGQSALSNEESARLSTQATRLAQRLDRKKNEYQDDLNAAQGEVVNAIGRKMVEVLNRYAQDNGITEVLDSSAQNSPLVYVAKGADVTQEIVRLYDQAYPVKTASIAPAAGTGPSSKSSPAPRPAAPTSAKPR